MLSSGESKSTTSYVLLSMNMMSTSNFEYEGRFHSIKKSMNAYKYHKLWVWFYDSTYLFEYLLLISKENLKSVGMFKIRFWSKNKNPEVTPLTFSTSSTILCVGSSPNLTINYILKNFLCYLIKNFLIFNE